MYSRRARRAVDRWRPRLEAKILGWSRRGPRDGSTHWSIRRLPAELGLTTMMVARAWARARLKPHRLERYMASDDPDFEAKAADVIAVYVNPTSWATPAGASAGCSNQIDVR